MFLFIILYFLKCFPYATLFDSFHYSLLIFLIVTYLKKEINQTNVGLSWT